MRDSRIVLSIVAAGILLILGIGGCGAGGGGTGAGTGTPPAALVPPPAPAGLAAEMGDQELTLDWVPVPNAVSYALYWSTVPGFKPAAGTKIPGATAPYIQTGLINKTTYYYLVTALNADGESEPSNQANATPVLTVTVPGDYLAIAAGIIAVPAGDRVLVQAGVYAGDVTVDKSMILDGSKGAATVSGKITVTADHVMVRNISVTNPANGFGIVVLGAGDVTIAGNTLHDIGTGSNPNGTAQAIYVSDNRLTAPLSGITISNNVINRIGNALQSGSNKGIFVGDSLANRALLDLVIQGNTISNVVAKHDAVFASGGRGAYGISINWGSSTALTATGTVIGSVMTGNTISGLSGFWVHAIGLEADTPNASVAGNTISALTATVDAMGNVDPLHPADGVGVFFQDNPDAATVTVTRNVFAGDLVFGVASASGAVNADGNWWGDASGPTAASNPGGTGSGAGPGVLFDPWCSTPDCLK